MSHILLQTRRSGRKVQLLECPESMLMVWMCSRSRRWQWKPSYMLEEVKGPFWLNARHTCSKNTFWLSFVTKAFDLSRKKERTKFLAMCERSLITAIKRCSTRSII